VDDLPWLQALLMALAELSHDLDVVFPVHPRTRQRIADLGLQALSNGHLRLLDPKPYLDFLALQQGAAMVITDSGGIQEETTFLGIPCLTLRANTERPVTVSLGTNVLIGRDIPRLQTEIRRILAGETKKCSPVPLWDGHAAQRIAQHLLGHC
jgi:UDP-N-acetylglucosamine 2-epimerase (non-hydrolysing)